MPSPITLRLASASYPTVGRVYAFDPARRLASVRFDGLYGRAIDTVSLDDLEAITPDRSLVDVETIVRRMAKEILPI